MMSPSSRYQKPEGLVRELHHPVSTKPHCKDIKRKRDKSTSRQTNTNLVLALAMKWSLQHRATKLYFRNTRVNIGNQPHQASNLRALGPDNLTPTTRIRQNSLVLPF
mmetsp:Transcript_18295/g.31694  ORF Transcript_18295/g.31694 Transcript_18295/m.31694 type:complete len:107 (-) Transcript_18295:579-899(-)